MINDVSALTYDGRSAGIVAASSVPVVLMHHQGVPETMQEDPHYDDVLIEVYRWLEERIAAAEECRDFARPDPDRSRLRLRQERRPQSRADERAFAIPLPRLRTCCRREPQTHDRCTVGRSPADKRLGGSIAFALKAAEQGAQIVRVHDVFETIQAVKVWRGLRDQALDAAGLGGGVDAEVAELAIERRAANPEAPRDFGHSPTIVADREPDDVRLDLFQRPQMAFARV